MNKVIIFDVGGTLISAKDLFKEAAKKLGDIKLHEDIRDKFWELTNNNSSLSEAQALLLASTTIANELGLDESKVAGLSEDVFIASSELNDDVIDTLLFLKNEGVVMIVASDSDYNLMVQELKNHKIHHFFADIITSSKVKAYKPSDVFVQKIVESININCPNPNKLFFVGDSNADIKTAIKLNAVPIFIARLGQVHNDAKYNIKNIAQLKEII